MTLPDPSRWSQLSALLDELMELDDAPRQARLSAIGQDQPDTATELRRMLAAGARARHQGFLTGAVAPPPDAQAPTSLVGQRLGAYVLEAPIGQGGGGSVWRARREDGRFDGAVAVKLLHLSLLGQAGAERFRREGQILARLAHPHIARLMDAGVAPGGQPYLVLELVQGAHLLQHCDTHRLGVAQRLALFDDVLAAVAHAHTHGVIHRDLKPGNILVTADGQVKLLDFGIAKLLDDESPESPATALTREGGRALTPGYAAPEQLRGEGVTPATDVYALGVLLYQLLTGRHPTAGNTASAAELLRGTLDTEPTRPSSAVTQPDAGPAAGLRDSTPLRLQRLLQGDLDTIITHALRKPAAERYATVAALAEDLRRHRAHEPVVARPDSWAYRTRKFVRRHRGGVAAGLITLLAIGAGLVGTVWQAQRAEKQAQLARLERDHAQRELAHTQAVQEILSIVLTSKGDRPLSQVELLDRSETLAREQFSQAPDDRARLLLFLAVLHSERASTERAAALLREARDVARQGPDRALEAHIDCAMAGDTVTLPDAAAAAALFRRAIDVVSAPPHDDLATRVECLNIRANRHLEAGAHADAAADWRTGLALYGAGRAGPASLAVGMQQGLASALAQSGDLVGGMAALKSAVSVLDRLGRGRTDLAGTLYNNLGVLQWRAGDPLGALASAETVDAINGGEAGQAAAVPIQALNRAALLVEVGRTSEGLALYEHWRGLARQRGDMRGLAQGTANFAHCPSGQWASCKQRLTEARQVLVGMLPPGSAIFGTLDTTLGRMALAHGEASTAQAYLQSALAIWDAMPIPPPQRSRSAAWMARTQLALGQPALARQHAESAVAQARRMVQGLPHSEWLGQALLALGLTLQAQGRLDEAKATWLAAVEQLDATTGRDAPGTTEARKLLAERR